MSNYEKFIGIVRKWPINPDRKNRDYGKHLRNLAAIRKEEIFPGNAIENSKMLDSLIRLLENKWFKEYSYKTGATGLNVDDLKRLLSDEYQEKMKNKKFSLR